MLRGVDLIDIVGWEIFNIFHIFLLFNQFFFCHRLNIDRCLVKACMIKASDHDMLDFTPELKQTCYDLMTDSERYVVKLINLCVLNK